MSAYLMVRVVHVVVAVLGAGLVVAVALVAREGHRQPPAGLLTLVRAAQGALGLLLVTGIAMGVLLGGALHEAWWFRLSGLALVATGVLIGRVRSLVLRWSAGEADTGSQASRTAWGACALVAVIALLMELKPF
jgi:hypothetical protein